MNGAGYLALGVLLGVGAVALAEYLVATRILDQHPELKQIVDIAHKLGV